MFYQSVTYMSLHISLKLITIELSVSSMTTLSSEKLLLSSSAAAEVLTPRRASLISLQIGVYTYILKYKQTVNRDLYDRKIINLLK